jgi:Spy/CpxP family protein refolding chaperone
MHHWLIALAIALAAGCSSKPAAPASSEYAGQQDREIKSLSAADIAELEAGRGWGLARSAELSGVPGPRHVLDLAAELALTADQRARFEEILLAMRRDAIAAGRAFIDAERRLSAAFAADAVTAETLERLVDASAVARARLRRVHLAAHLATAPILDAGQRDRYRQLRGYGAADPCARVPAGHDPVMWRRHNGCDE